MLNLREIGLLYHTEVRMALRERTIVVNSILIPLLLYPALMWLVFTGFSYVQGQTEGFTSRVAVVGSVPALLQRDLERGERIALVKPAPAATQATEQVRSGKLELLVEFLPEGGALPGNFQARISFDGSKERSSLAKERFTRLLDTYRAGWLKKEAQARGISGNEWATFTLDSRNVASSRDMTALLLGLLLPMMFILMLAIGCFYPAVDATAGERERGTWETLMSTGARRSSILVAKYLYVLSFGVMGGMLNLSGMLLTFKPMLGPLLEGTGATVDVHLPWLVLPVVVLTALLLAAFVAAGMMILASFARTFKDGQAMVTPFYLLILLPVMFLSLPDLKFSLALACIPIANIAMMIRSAIGGNLPWLPALITVGVTAALIFASLRLALFILRFEDVQTGSYAGDFRTFFTRRILKRERASQASSKASSEASSEASR